MFLRCNNNVFTIILKMELQKAIDVLNTKGITAYEIHKDTGLNEASLRKVLKGEVVKPQKKTRKVIVE